MARRELLDRILELLLLSLFPVRVLSAAEPPAKPMLRIEMETHTGAVRGVVSDPLGRFVLTAGDDKTIRLWRRPDMAAIAVHRPPAGEGVEGQLVSLALSPSAERVAAGGTTCAAWDGTYCVYVFHSLTGNLVRRIGGLPDVPVSIAFSADSTRLAIGMQGRGGLRIYEISSGALLERQEVFGDSVAGLSWQKEKLAASSLDGRVRVWRTGDGGLKSLAEYPGDKNEPAYGVSLSPDGKRLAVGVHGKPIVRVLDAETLQMLFLADTANVANGDLSNTAWDSGGDALYAAGTYARKNKEGKVVMVIRRWGQAGRGNGEDFAVASNTILSLAPVPGGGVVFGSSDSTWGEFSPTAKTKRVSQIRGFQSKKDTLLTSRDGSVVEVADVRFEVPNRLLAKSHAEETVGPRITAPWVSAPDGILFALAHEGQGMVASFGGRLRRLDSKKNELWQSSTLPSDAYKLNVADRGGKVLAALEDGTIRWYDYADGREILALFSHPDGQRWVMWTPEGYYDASAGGESLIGWHLNQGKDKEARFVPNSQLYDVFYRPDIVQAKFKGDDISGLITLTAEQALKSPPPEIVLTKLPTNSASTKEQVCYKITSTGGGIGEVRVFQNGKLVKSDGFYREAVAKREDSLKLASVNSQSVTRSLRALKLKQADLPNLPAGNKGNTVEECQPIEPIAGDNELGVVAFNAQNTVQSSMAEGRFVSKRPAEDPYLHILAIGIDQFADRSANLKFAGKDAKDFLELVRQKTGALFKAGNVRTASLGNKDATKQGILKKIDELATQIKAGDTFILFVASHGVLLGNQYYLVSSGYDGTADLKNLVGSNEIVELSKKIKALSQLYVFDTCHAGGVDNLIGGLYDARMSVLAKKMGLHIYAAAGGLQEALDGYQGNGLFTYSLIDSLKQPTTADINQDGKISVMELGKAAKDQTMAISKKIGHPQTPTMIHFGKDVSLFESRSLASENPPVYKDCPDCPEMIGIPEGSFEMGSNDGDADERPVHRVTVPSFAIGQHEVTQAQWAAVMGGNPSGFKGCDTCPVEQVSWDDIQGFLQKLNAKTGKRYRLPSEAEWEYACRGGGKHTYCGSGNIDEVAWYDRNGGRKTHPVGQKQANAFGLYDMSGNVWEWVLDCWNENYAGAPTDGSVWASGNCGRHMLRGGSWSFLPQGARAAFRARSDSASRGESIGFRVAHSGTGSGKAMPGASSASAERTSVIVTPMAAGSLAQGRRVRHCPDCPEMVEIPGGRFVMGADKTEPEYKGWEAPAHAVQVPGFLIGRTEVTRGQWAAFVAATGYGVGDSCNTHEDAGGYKERPRTWRNPGFEQTDDHPVVCVSAVDAEAYAAWMSRKSGKSYRLPTEAEWEYAARAGSTTRRFWGNDLDRVCEYANTWDKAGKSALPSKRWEGAACSDGYGYTSPVARFKPNAFGLFDMIGNVGEWMQDCYNDHYMGAPTNGEAWKRGDCRQRMMRGSDFLGGGGLHLRSAYRDYAFDSKRDSSSGFRLAASVDHAVSFNPAGMKAVTIVEPGYVLSTPGALPNLVIHDPARFPREQIMSAIGETDWPDGIRTLEQRNNKSSTPLLKGLKGYAIGTDGTALLVYVPRGENAGARFEMTKDFFVMVSDQRALQAR